MAAWATRRYWQEKLKIVYGWFKVGMTLSLYYFYSNNVKCHYFHVCGFLLFLILVFEPYENSHVLVGYGNEHWRKKWDLGQDDSFLYGRDDPRGL